jgi:hypothetical protein
MNWKTTQKDELDRFYTKQGVANQCVGLFVEKWGTNFKFVEPSAGGGAFIDALFYNKCSDVLAYDIAPMRDDIIEADTLHNLVEMGEGHVVIGNPPYGKNSSLIKKFTDWATNCGAGTIAFILPATYNKPSRQNTICHEYKLILSVDLPDESFTLNEQDYHIPAVFQVWSRVLDGDDLRKSASIPANSYFDFCKLDVADGFIMGAAPSRLKAPENVKRTNRGYWIKFKKGVAFGNIDAILADIDWKAAALSSVSGGVAWFSKQQISEEVNKYDKQQSIT